MEWSAGYFNSTRPGDVTISFDPKRHVSKYSTDDFFGGVTYETQDAPEFGNSLFVSFSNLGITLGTVIGEWFIANLGTHQLIWGGITFALIAKLNASRPQQPRVNRCSGSGHLAIQY